MSATYNSLVYEALCSITARSSYWPGVNNSTRFNEEYEELTLALKRLRAATTEKELRSAAFDAVCEFADILYFSREISMGMTHIASELAVLSDLGTARDKAVRFALAVEAVWRVKCYSHTTKF